MSASSSTATQGRRPGVKLPEAVTAVSPNGGVLDGTAAVPGSKAWEPAAGAGQQQDRMWACRVRGCSRTFARADPEKIAGHLDMHLEAVGPGAAIPVTLTPELGAWWLESTRRRRPITEANWKRIPADITDGNWIFDGNPLGFDTDGNLIQGGHRARAVIETGRDVQSALMAGLNPDASITMDTSKGQKFGDVLHAHGVKDANHAAAAAGLLWRQERGHLDPATGFGHRLRPSNPQLMRLWNEQEGDIRAAMAAVVPLCRVAHRASKGALAGTLILISRKAGPGFAAGFFSALALEGGNEQGHGSRDPVAAWHRKWSRQSGSDRLRVEEQAALTIKAWNSWIRGAAVSKLVWVTTGERAEKFPVVSLPPLAARDEDAA